MNSDFQLLAPVLKHCGMHCFRYDSEWYFHKLYFLYVFVKAVFFSLSCKQNQWHPQLQGTLRIKQQTSVKRQKYHVQHMEFLLHLSHGSKTTSPSLKIQVRVNVLFCSFTRRVADMRFAVDFIRFNLQLVQEVLPCGVSVAMYHHLDGRRLTLLCVCVFCKVLF